MSRSHSSSLPRDWSWSGTGLGVLVSVVTAISFRKGWLPMPWPGVLWSLAVVTVFAAWIVPHRFQTVHRIMSAIRDTVGRLLGALVFRLIYLFVITPIGLWWRMTGRDPLRLKVDRNAETHWNTSRAETPLDRMF